MNDRVEYEMSEADRIARVPELEQAYLDLRAEVARLREALNERQDGGKDFWMNWVRKRLEIRNAMFLRDAKLALAGDMRALRNRVELMETEPMSITLSTALQEDSDE